MASLYGAGAAIGFSPEQVKAMSVWEFNAVLTGYAKAHGGRGGNSLSDDEKAELFEWIEAGNDTAVVRRTTVYDWDGQRLVPAATIIFRVS